MKRGEFIQALFDGAAGRWERDVMPLLAPLIGDFARFAAVDAADHVLDAGTGTGTLARMVAPLARHVTGVDISPAMLELARKLSAGHRIAYMRGDLHRLPFAGDSFSLIIASFGLNSTAPDRCLRELRRVIAPGGRLAIQEWGAAGPLYEALIDTLEEYAVSDPAPEPLARLRAGIEEYPPLWERELQDADDYAGRLAALDFEVLHAGESQPVTIRLPSIEPYLAFLLSTTIRCEEVHAMPDATRAAFFAAARAHLDPFTAPDGSLTWRPAVIRVLARRSG